MIEINKNVVFVQGALNGAIYDFNFNKVYSINEDACNIINKLKNNSSQYSDTEKNYIEVLKKNNLLSDAWVLKEYYPENKKDIELNLVWLEITQACNLRCVHCYEGDIHKASTKHLSLDEWKKVIDEINELKVKRVVVIGGEPCCSNQLVDILEYLSKYKINTTLFTNGTLFNEKLFETIINNNISVKFSLYGHNEKIHDNITKVNGSFNKLINTVERLLAANIKVDIAVVAMKENQEYQNDIKQLIDKLGVKYNGYDVIRNVFGGTQNLHTPNKIEILKSSIMYKPYFTTAKKRFDELVQRNSCWYGKIVINEDGFVLPCVFERNITYGNIKEQSVIDIIKSDKLLEHWFLDYSKINTCCDCEYRFACKDCRPVAISVNGNIADKNPRCLYNPYKGIWKGKYE